MKQIDYDFSSFAMAFDEMKNKMPTPNNLLVIKEELNRFFRDSKCKEVLYTTNTDKMFFGIKIIV